jgi:hypothetical protein
MFDILVPARGGSLIYVPVVDAAFEQFAKQSNVRGISDCWGPYKILGVRPDEFSTHEERRGSVEVKSYGVRGFGPGGACDPRGRLFEYDGSRVPRSLWESLRGSLRKFSWER